MDSKEEKRLDAADAHECSRDERELQAEVSKRGFWGRFSDFLLDWGWIPVSIIFSCCIFYFLQLSERVSNLEASLPVFTQSQATLPPQDEEKQDSESYSAMDLFLSAQESGGGGLAELPENLRQLGESGDANAWNLLGRCYESGLGCETNKWLAGLYFRKAAEMGDLWGRYNVALYYWFGDFVDENGEVLQRNIHAAVGEMETVKTQAGIIGDQSLTLRSSLWLASWLGVPSNVDDYAGTADLQEAAMCIVDAIRPILQRMKYREIKSDDDEALLDLALILLFDEGEFLLEFEKVGADFAYGQTPKDYGITLLSSLVERRALKDPIVWRIMLAMGKAETLDKETLNSLAPPEVLAENAKPITMKEMMEWLLDRGIVLRSTEGLFFLVADRERIFNGYRKAWEKGDKWVAETLSKLFDGMHFPVDPFQEIDWLRKSVPYLSSEDLEKCGDALYRLGTMYGTGRGLFAQNDGKATRLLLNCRDIDCTSGVSANNGLFWRFLHEWPISTTLPDSADAAWLNIGSHCADKAVEAISADEDYPPRWAPFLLGAYAVRTNDLSAAKQWISVASSNGLNVAGIMLKRWEDVAESTNQPSSFARGSRFMLGVGDVPDWFKAVKAFQEGADAGDMECQQALVEMLDVDWWPGADVDKAKATAQVLVNNGDVWAAECFLDWWVMSLFCNQDFWNEHAVPLLARFADDKSTKIKLCKEITNCVNHHRPLIHAKMDSPLSRDAIGSFLDSIGDYNRAIEELLNRYSQNDVECD